MRRGFSRTRPAVTLRRPLGVRAGFMASALVLSTLTQGCALDLVTGDLEPAPVLDDGPDEFTAWYRHESSLVTVTVPIGLWMHKTREHARSAVADWLEVPQRDKELLEPINVLWVDPTSPDEETVNRRIDDFLEACGLIREADYLIHSGAYSASYAPNYWRGQTKDTWVSGRFTGSVFTNNHGRVFPTYSATSDQGTPVYFTSGAFSREGGSWSANCVLGVADCHSYRSFNQARDALQCDGTRGWRIVGTVDLGNEFPYLESRSFHTGDHDGVLVFERIE